MILNSQVEVSKNTKVQRLDKVPTYWNFYGVSSLEFQITGFHAFGTGNVLQITFILSGKGTVPCFTT